MRRYSLLTRTLFVSALNALPPFDNSSYQDLKNMESIKQMKTYAVTAIRCFFSLHISNGAAAATIAEQVLATPCSRASCHVSNAPL